MILGNNVSFYDVKISGKDIKRFLHNLHKMHIEFLNIVFEKNSVIIKVSEEDYKKILTIKTIYEEIDSQLDFDIYTAKRIYYSDNWFVAVDLNGELHYECIAGAEYQFLTVLNDVKRQLDEGVRR